VAALRLSFRVLSPASNRGVPHAEPSALPAILSPRAGGYRSCVSRPQVGRRAEPSCPGSGLSSHVAGASWASSEGAVGKPLHTSTSFYAFQHGGPNRCCPPSAAARSVVQLSKQRQAVQPKSLKRTAGAVSSDGGLWSFSLRGAAVACMGRSLSSQTLAASQHQARPRARAESLTAPIWLGS
jgi:hypothetical protein